MKLFLKPITCNLTPDTSPLAHHIHCFSDQRYGAAVIFCTGAFVAQHGAVLACSGEAGEQPIEVFHENGGGATFGGLLFDVGEVCFEE